MFNELFDKLTKVKCVGEAVEKTASLMSKRSGLDLDLCKSLVDDVHNYAQFKAFAFTGVDIKYAMTGRTPEDVLRILFESRSHECVKIFVHNMKKLIPMSDEELSEVQSDFDQAMFGLIEKALNDEFVTSQFNEVISFLKSNL